MMANSSWVGTPSRVIELRRTCITEAPITTPRIVPFTSPQAASTQHRCGDGIQLIEVSKIYGLGGIHVQDKEQASQAGQAAADHVGENGHSVRVNPAVPGSFLIPSQGQQISPVDGSVQKDGPEHRHDHENQEGGGDGKTIHKREWEFPGSQGPEGGEVIPEALGLIRGDPPARPR